MELDLRQLSRAVRRWWWIAFTVPVVCALLAFGISTRQQPKYAATATLMINPASGSGTLDYNSVLTAERLSKTYQKLVKNRVVLDQVIADLQLPFTADELGSQITPMSDGDTQLMTISVSDTEPQRTAAIANSVAQRFREYVVSDLAAASADDLATFDASIQDLQSQIQATQNELNTLNARSDAADPAVQGQIDGLIAKLQSLQTGYAQLVTLSTTIRANSALAGNQISIAEPASAPQFPYAPNKIVNIMLGLMIGGILAVGAILILEYLDNTVKATSDFGSLIGAPLLSTVASIPKLTQGRKQLFVLEHPKSGAAESIRLLRTNIEFASATKEIAILGITSADPGEGKSTMAANLAITLAQAGFETALIDADLRRPSQHRIFGLGNDRGLSTLLSVPTRTWDWARQATPLSNLTLIPAGPLPPNPADLLSLGRMRELLSEMRQTFDVIVIDTPPVLMVSDPLIVAAHVDGMILVSRSNKTRLDALKRAAVTMQRGAIRIVGVIVNHQPGRTIEGYYYTEYRAVDESPKSNDRRGGRSDPPRSLTTPEQAHAD
jgi:polysaccharide biosynthesis transport protein